MGDLSGERRMLPLADISWNRILPEGSNPISCLLQKDIPIYFMVARNQHLVYAKSRGAPLPWGDDQRKRIKDIPWVSASEDELDSVQLPYVGIKQGIAYLRLHKDSVEDIGQAGESKTPRFVGCGLAKVRAHRVTGHDLRGHPIREPEEISKVEDLEKVEFDEAFIIDRKKIGACGAYWQMGAQFGFAEFLCRS